MPAENAAPIAMAAIQNNLWPTLISFRGLLLVANGDCRESRNDAGLCSVRKPASPTSPARSACRNQMTDRGLWVTVRGCRLNVRRLMYQTLIWPAVLGDDARGLGASFDAKKRRRAAHQSTQHT